MLLKLLASKIYQWDKDRMNKLNRDIRLFYFKNRFDMDMRGGATREHEIIYKGHKIYYNNSRNVNGDINTLFIFGGRDAGRRPCFEMSIKDKVASLISIERGVDCFVDRHNNTRDVVELAFQIATERGCTAFNLTDNSYIRCPPYRFNLSDVYFLTTGQTWYESILPIKIKSWSEHELEEYRQTVKKTKWTTISKYLSGKGVDLEFITNLTDGVDVNKTGSALAILSRIKHMKNVISCRFFSQNIDKILVASRVPSLYGKLWSYEE